MGCPLKQRMLKEWEDELELRPEAEKRTAHGKYVPQEDIHTESGWAFRGSFDLLCLIVCLALVDRCALSWACAFVCVCVDGWMGGWVAAWIQTDTPRPHGIKHGLI